MSPLFLALHFRLIIFPPFLALHHSVLIIQSFVFYLGTIPAKVLFQAPRSKVFFVSAMENILKIKIFIAVLSTCLVSSSAKGDNFLGFQYIKIHGVNYSFTSHLILSTALQIGPNNGGGSSPRIIGGQEAPLGSVPHQVHLRQTNNLHHLCGGSIIDADFILSTAHCCAVGPPTAIFAGLNNIDQSEEGAQKVTIDAIVIHPNYSRDGRLLNDICILRLGKSLKLGEDTRTATIQLPPSGYSASGAANVTGWGSIEEGGPSSATLMVVQVPIITDYQWLVHITMH